MLGAVLCIAEFWVDSHLVCNNKSMYTRSVMFRQYTCNVILYMCMPVILISVNGKIEYIARA